jgi:eukaryotic-like serine/threonine-protein kinase
MTLKPDTRSKPSLAELTRIDAACLQFEAAWKNGLSPLIEDFLEQAEGCLSAQDYLLTELLALEIDYRQRRGLKPSAAEYRSRFPEKGSQIDAAFNRARETGASGLPIGTHVEVAHRFRVDEFHAGGGLGAVYRATDESFARTVAVKFPRNRAADPAEYWRLEREAAITSRLEHPGIVPVYAVRGGGSDQPFYVMKFVEGETFRVAVDRLFAGEVRPSAAFYQGLPFRKLLQRLIDVCNTVAFAHGRGIVHRDIKPGNIMLGPFGETLLVDWGLAADMNAPPETTSTSDIGMAGTPSGDGSNTLPGQALGTPEFASPEQISGRQVTPSPLSDVYSLGATLYYLLTGRRPIDAGQFAHSINSSINSSINGSINDSVHRNIPAPRVHQPSIPRALEAICRRAMAFEPEARFASVEQLADDLERYLADEPVSQAIDRWPTRLARWSRKHPARAAALLATTVVGCVALAIGSWLLANRDKRLDEAGKELGQAGFKLSVASEEARAAERQAALALRSLTDGAILRLLARQENLSAADQGFLRRLQSDFREFASSTASETKTVALQVEGFYRIGEIHKVLGETDAALEYFQRAIELGSNVAPTTAELNHAVAIAQVLCGDIHAICGDYDAGVGQLERGASALRALVEANPEEPRFQYGLACAELMLGNIHRRQNAAEPALAALRTSQSILETLAASAPDNLEFAWSLAGSRTLQAWTILAEQPAAAETAFQSALEIQQRLMAAAPDRVTFQKDAAATLAGLGMVHHRLQRAGQAELHMQQAVDLCGKIIAAHPSWASIHDDLIDCRYRFARMYTEWKRPTETEAQLRAAVDLIADKRDMLSVSTNNRMIRRNVHMNLGLLLQKRGVLPEAEAQFRAGVEVARELADGQPTIENAIALGNTLIPLASLLGSLKRPDEAVDCYEEVIAGVLKFPAEEQMNPAAVKMLVTAHRATGNLQLAAEKLDLAAPHWEWIGQHATDAESITARCKLAVCLAESDAVRAGQVIESVSTQSPLAGTDLFNLACAAGLAAQSIDHPVDQDAFVVMSFEFLERAFDQKYFSNSSRRQLLQKSRAFNGMRERDEYRRLQERIEAAADSSAQDH